METGNYNKGWSSSGRAMVEHIANVGIYEIFLEVITVLPVIRKNRIDHVRGENKFILTEKNAYSYGGLISTAYSENENNWVE